MEDLGKRTKIGLLFKFAERVGAQSVNFLVTIILARLLLPEEFGLISLVAVVIAVLDVFVTYGFGNSLIVNKKSDKIDFSTCFFFGITLSVFVYIVLYFCSPIIASFYENEQLIPLLRVMGLRLPIAAVNSVQQAYVSKNMMFKMFFYSTSIGTISSGIISIFFAYRGYGVWALVMQYLSNAIIDTICLWIFVGWRPILVFSIERLKNIYNYGWKILVVGLIDTIYNQLRGLVIAKKFSTTDLAYYGKGTQFPSLFQSIIDPTINGVLFPALSSCNDNKKEMLLVTRRITQVSSFFIFPLMIGLLVVAKPLIEILLTDKWLDCVIYLQIGCLAFLFRAVQVINICVIQASGRSGLLLKMDVLKKGVGVALLVVSIPFGVLGIAWSLVITNIIATIINVYPNKKLLDYGYLDQMMDVVESLSISILMGGIIYFVGKLPISTFFVLFFQLIAGCLVYVILSILFKNKSFFYILSEIKTKIKKHG